MVLSGHCLCKAVTYKVDVDAPLITGYDHCDDCQRQSGSTYCKSSSLFFIGVTSSVSFFGVLGVNGGEKGEACNYDVFCSTPPKPRPAWRTPERLGTGGLGPGSELVC